MFALVKKIYTHSASVSDQILICISKCFSLKSLLLFIDTGMEKGREAKGELLS